MKVYQDKFEEISTLKELFDFREKLLLIEGDYAEGLVEGNIYTNIKRRQEVNFWIERATNRIRYLEVKGMFLDKIETAI